MKYSILLILTLLLLSCNKKQLTFTLQGQAFDLSFNTGLANASVAIYEVGTNGAEKEDPIATGLTDSKGVYKISFDRNNVSKYIVRINKENYFEIEETLPFDDLSTEIATVRNYFTSAKSWVKLTFKNVSPSSAADQLRFIKQDGKEACAECCPDTERFVNGTQDSVFYCVNDGNSLYSYLYWSVNPSANGVLSITTIPFDTVEIVNNW